MRHALPFHVVLAASAAVLTSGCRAVSSEEPVLQGSWGSDYWEVTASQSALVLNQGCYRVTFVGPIQLIQADSFAVTGTLTWSTWKAEIGQPWHAWGSVSGDTLRLAFSYRFLGDTSQWLPHNGNPTVLVAGQHSDWFSNPTCPL